MKVLTLSTRYSVGGAQLNSYLVAEQLSTRGYITKSCFIFHVGDMSLSGVVPYEICGKKNNVYLSIKKLFYVIRDFKPDVVIGFHPFANVMASFFSFFFKYKVIATQRNPSTSMSIKTKYIEMFFGMFVPAANICVSGSVMQSFRSYPKSYRDRLKVVYNGLPAFDVKVMNDFEFPGFVIGFIGRLDNQKNPDLLIDMAFDLKKIVNFTLVIAGDGPLRQALENRVDELGLSDVVVFLGAISGDSIYDFYSAIDIFVMPSLYEGFGRTVLENMMFGNPMVLSDIDVLKEVASDTAFFAKSTHSDFGRMVLHVLSLSESYKLELKVKMCQRANDFTIEKMIDGYETEVRKCL